MHYFLGAEVRTDKKSEKATLTQGGLTKKVLNTVGMLDSNKKITPEETMPLVTDAYVPSFDKPWEYASIVGMLMYLYRNSRPDIQFAVHQCTMFNHNTSRSHAEAVKRIFCYLVASQGQGLNFDPNIYMNLDCYVDEDFAGICKCEDDQYPVCEKSRARYVMTLGGCPFNWVSNLHTEISLSTLEAE